MPGRRGPMHLPSPAASRGLQHQQEAELEAELGLSPGSLIQDTGSPGAVSTAVPGPPPPPRSAPLLFL